MTDPSRTPWLTTRAAALAGVAVVCLATAAVLCGPNLGIMLMVAVLDGGKAALWVGGATALGDVLLRACGATARGPLRVASAGGIGLGVFSLGGLGLGLLGWLNQPVAVAFPAVGYVGLGVDLFRRGALGGDRDAVVAWLRGPAGWLWAWAVPAASLTGCTVAAGLMPGVLWKPLDPHPYDVTSYHLQVPREWYAAGRVVPLRHNMFSYFPMNAEVQYLLLDHAAGGPNGPWEAMYAAQFLSVGETLLMVLAVAGAVGGVGERSTSDVQRSTFKGGPAIAATVAAAVPWVVMLGSVAYVEAMLMLYTALAVAWALRATATATADDRGGFVRPLVVAGAFAGLACGTKITAVPMLLAAVPVAVAAAVGRAVPWRRLAVGCGAFVVVGSVVVAPWLVRTAAWAGNPLWPVGMSVLGRDHFSPGQVERFRVAHSPRPEQRSMSARAGVLWRDVIAHWQYGFVLLPAGAVAMGVRWRDGQTRLLVVTAFVILVVWFGFTHLLARFLVMLVPVAAVAVGRAAAGRLWPAGAAVAMAAAACGWWGVGPVLADWSASPVRGSFFGVNSFADLTAHDPRLRAAMAGGEQVGLVGDAQAFFFEMPMDRLHYRTVFDLPADDPDAVTAWVGPAAVGNPGWLLVANPAEVDRLHGTYVATPPVPPAWATRGSETFLLGGEEVKR